MLPIDYLFLVEKCTPVNPYSLGLEVPIGLSDEPKPNLPSEDFAGDLHTHSDDGGDFLIEIFK